MYKELGLIVVLVRRDSGQLVTSLEGVSVGFQ